MLILEIIETAGLKVLIDSMAVRRGDLWRSVMQPGIWLGNVIEGHVEVDQQQFGNSIWCKGQAAVFSSDKPMETEHRSLTDGSLSAIFIQIDPDGAENWFGSETIAAIAAAAGKAQSNATAIVSAISWQMLGCPLRGQARNLYMAGKALELIAHLLPDEDAHAGRGRARWTARDIECFHAARSILLADLANPPSVGDLARMVGTNARKLGAGFVDLFGTPVYAFVKSRRLDEARHLLEAGETSISGVAQGMGYHPAHFATEFRKRFGVSPTEVIGKRRTL
ncbi:helix-turn-helix transcriptional regulator [Ochrobactrum pecoris]|uniref:AraC family transcriptional activator of pyochelin receptor n=1 Tax=Brucella pecoris TaxID=867683 RepID=A0A5C5CE28_9HYPH|nr:AraC family transcriptional regulator [Brucella pecoris]MBB4095655.1 AraC family transcriptional activator of pyochelin receptor [Brucella pecoris]NKW81827.1 helix-turn-helix transcriptional regulator [Brucella pecoris]TNV09639.1 helix-turn-helix transcriptional regulator [Brucella pecoris]